MCLSAKSTIRTCGTATLKSSFLAFLFFFSFLHPLWYTPHNPSTAQSSKSSLSGPQINNCPSQSRGFSQLRFSTLHKLLSVHSWLNCPCSPVTQRIWAEAITRDLNEVVNFELTPFRVTDDVNMCCEFGLSCIAAKRAEWPLTCVTPPNLFRGEVNEACWGEGH